MERWDRVVSFRLRLVCARNKSDRRRGAPKNGFGPSGDAEVYRRLVVIYK